MNLTKLLFISLIFAVIISCITARPARQPRKRKKGKRTKKSKKLPPPPTTLEPPRGSPESVADLGYTFEDTLEGMVCIQYEMLELVSAY